MATQAGLAGIVARAPIRLHLQLADPGSLATDCVSPSEYAQAQRRRHAEGRTAYLGARAHQRLCLSLAAREFAGVDVAPRRWTFANDAWGKPRIVEPSLGLMLHFSLSTTRGRVGIAVSPDVPLGLDLEQVTPHGDELALARRYFHPVEQRWLALQPADEHALAFTRLWTLKEAYVKARGQGLSLGLDGYWFELDAPEPMIHFEPHFADANAWWFAQEVLGDSVLALACPRMADAEG